MSSKINLQTCEYACKSSIFQDNQLIYRKYYKKILDAISEENCFPDSCSGGGVYLREAILKKVPEITEEQLRMIWRELPFVLEKRTQDWIERERQFSEKYIREQRKETEGVF